MAWPFRKNAPASGSRPKAERREWIGAWEALPLSSLAITSWSRSYQQVEVQTGENSLQSVAYRSAVDLMCSLVSELPFAVYSGTGIDRRTWPTPENLLDPAGDGYGVEDWLYQFIQSQLMTGNALGSIVDKGPTGMLRQVDLWHPDCVGSRVEDGRPIWTYKGREVPNEWVFHRRAFPVAGCLMGLSPIQAHADTLGLTISATRFGKAWFQDGGHPGGILSNSEADMSDDKVVRTAKDRFMAALFGNREPVVLGRGWKFDQIQIAPEESQFLETQGMTEAQCARIVGPGVAEVLGYDTGGSMTYANVVDRDIELLKYAANKWLKRAERTMSAFLPRPRYVQFDRDAFLETSVMQRWAVNQKKLAFGAYTINEIRRQNNDKPVEWGDEPFAPPTAASTDSEPSGGQPPAPGGGDE